jgi:hypothetical protein
MSQPNAIGPASSVLRNTDLDGPSVGQARVEHAEPTARQMAADGGEAARLHLAGIGRILDREAPDYRR